MPQETRATPKQVRIFTASLVGGSSLLAVVVALILSGTTSDENLWWVVAILFAAILALTTLAARRWSRTEPLALDDPEPTTTAMTRLTSHIASTFPLLEVPLIATMTLAFLGLITYEVTLVAFATSISSLVFGLWPTRDHIDRFATALEASGARSGLREAFAR